MVAKHRVAVVNEAQPLWPLVVLATTVTSPSKARVGAFLATSGTSVEAETEELLLLLLCALRKRLSLLSHY